MLPCYIVIFTNEYVDDDNLLTMILNMPTWMKLGSITNVDSLKVLPTGIDVYDKLMIKVVLL